MEDTLLTKDNIPELIFKDNEKYFKKVVDWDKDLALKFQRKFGLSDYQMLCVSFAKGFIIGALIL